MMVPSYLPTGLPLGVFNHTKGPSPSLALYPPIQLQDGEAAEGQMSNLLRTFSINDLY